MNSGVESLKRCPFSPSWEQVQRKGSCRLLLDQLKFCWNSTPHARNAKTVYGERHEHGDTMIIMPRSIGQIQKATYARRHGARSSSRRMLQPSTVGTLTTVTSYLRTENVRGTPTCRSLFAEEAVWHLQALA